MSKFIPVFWFSFLFISWFILPLSSSRVDLICRTELEGPVAHGIGKLQEAIGAKGGEVNLLADQNRSGAKFKILAGLSEDPEMAALIETGGLELPVEPESLAIRRLQQGEQDTLVLCGADPVGLMYAVLDTTDRIGWIENTDDLFAQIRNTSESPVLVDRSISTYTMQRAWWEERLYDPQYWERYFDRLAEHRLNSYVIIFGYECAGFMAPLYPYFFDVQEFPEVRLTGITAEEQARNTEALRKVIALAHERGIRFTMGIWDHIYRGGVQGGGIAGADDIAGKKVSHLVQGVTAENLASYTKAALNKLLTVFPDIDGIQFRMHWESGLTREETPRFWHDVFALLQELNPDIRFDLRAKGLPDVVIEDAIEQDIPFRITTKYWMEQLGLPFHPTHVNPQNQKDRRHGYADLLRYPKRYDMHWRIWTAGTARFLLWANPDYVRRFVESAQIYDGDSFEVNEMLATKMLGAPHDAEPFQLHADDYRHYQNEIERYWHYFQVWGRLAYNPGSDPQLWQREFVDRFGKKTGPVVMRALHQASEVLPRIVAASYNYRFFPTTRGWSEMMRIGDLDFYADGTGTDVEQFQGYRDAARDILDGQSTALRTPQESAAWFSAVAAGILRDIDLAVSLNEERVKHAEKEFQATLADLRILANLASYHAARMPAAVWFNVYRETEDTFALEQSLAGELEAIAAWRRIIAAAEGVYGESMRFGAIGREFPEHWKEELGYLEAGLETLKQLPSRNTLDGSTRNHLVRRMQPLGRTPVSIEVERASIAVPGEDLVVSAKVEDPKEIQWIQLRYRHLSQFEDYQTETMIWDPDSKAKAFTATIPGNFITSDWDLMYFVEAVDKAGRGAKLPDLEEEMPYVIVPVRR